MNVDPANVKNVVVSSFSSYDKRRYSRPWICKMSVGGKYDFSSRIGCYTGRDGEEGELVLFQPNIDQVYAYGQKDRRGNNTLIEYVKWDGNRFLVCNKPGRNSIKRITKRQKQKVVGLNGGKVVRE